MTKKALGKGLSALIPEGNKQRAQVSTFNDNPKGKEITEIPVNKIKPNPLQPRTEFDEEKLQELISSIKQKGIIQPIVVRQKKDVFEIVVGERRFKAASTLKLSSIPAIVIQADDEEALELALIENIQRADLNPIEEAKAYEMLMDKYSLTQEGVGEKVGKSRESVANMLRLLNLSEDIQRFVLEERISTGHARALLGLKSEEKQRDLAGRIIAQRLSVREVEKLVSMQLGAAPGTRKKKKSASRSVSPYVQSMADKMQEKIGTKVSIKESAKPGFGKIEIEYYSHDDLDRIFHFLG